MPDHTTPESREVGYLPYILGGISFIPCLGVPFGLVVIIWGIVKRVNALILIGCLGILFSVVLYGGLFYFGMYQRSGVYDKLRAQMAATMLNSTVKEIEFYKVQHGSYPQTLKDLDAQEKNSFSTSMDPTAMERSGSLNDRFYYELDPSGKFYYLRSVGLDGIPFSADDILPSLPASETQNTGLRLAKPEESQKSQPTPDGK